MAVKNNFLIEKWSSWNQKLNYRQKVNGRPVNLTGCTAKMQLRASPSSTEVLFELSTENGRIKSMSSNGYIELVITDEDTGGITFQSAVYDLVISFPDGTKKRLIEGKITISDGVTR